MLNTPAKPLAAGLDPDGVVRLRRTRQPVDLRSAPHIPGSQLLPGALPIEQDIVWVFPNLAASPLTPHAVREQVRTSWAYTVGTLFHRSLIHYASIDDPSGTWVDGLRRAAQSAVDALYTVRMTDVPAVDAVAGLETPVDLFGAPDEGLLRAVSWGFGAEFWLADAYGDAYRQNSTDIVRYRSRESLFTQEWTLMQRRLPELTRHYIAGAYDILHVWGGGRSSVASLRRSQARTLGDELLGFFPAR